MVAVEATAAAAEEEVLHKHRHSSNVRLRHSVHRLNRLSAKRLRSGNRHSVRHRRKGRRLNNGRCRARFNDKPRRNGNRSDKLRPSGSSNARRSAKPRLNARLRRNGCSSDKHSARRLRNV
jgi:hypothetical protein